MPEIPDQFTGAIESGVDRASGSGPNYGEPGHQIDLHPDLSAYITTVAPDDGRNAGGPTTGGSGIPTPGEAGVTTGLIGDINPLSIVVKTDRWSAASSTEVVIAPQSSPVFPDTGVDLEAYINGTRVGAGRLEEAGPKASSKEDDKGGIVPSTQMSGGEPKAETGITLVGYDELRYLSQKTITKSYQNVRLSTVVNDIFSAADVSGDVRLRYNPRITADYNNQKCRYLLTQLAHRVRGIFRVNARGDGNRLVFTDRPNFIRHNIGGILEIDTGLQQTPYDGVRVIGGVPRGGSGGGGGPPGATFAQSPVIATAGRTGKKARVYPHPDKTIRSKPAAQRLANSLLDEFRRQQQQGVIKIVGNAAVQPVDTVKTPPSFGGTEYAVSTVEHVLSTGSGKAGGAGSSQKGFRTNITVNGVVGDERGGANSQPLMGPIGASTGNRRAPR